MAPRPVVIVLLAIAALAAPASPAEDRRPLDRIAALAGEWALLDPTGEPSVLRARYEIVAGGAAVLEWMFAGTPEETLTLYHAEGAELSATQVSGRCGPCRLGPAPVEPEGTLAFVAPEESPAPGSIVAIRLTPRDKDGLRVEWIHCAGDNRQESRVFDFRRDTDLAGLSAEVARLRVSLETLTRELDRRLKRELEVDQKGKPRHRILQTITRPPGPGWTVVGVPFREFLHQQSIPFSTTYSVQGDPGMTVGHYGFRAGNGCRVRFSVLGGNAFIAVVLETRAPPREIRSIPEFATALETGACGRIVERISGEQWAKHPVAVDWDLERFAGQAMRLYVVDAVTNHYGQIALSDIRIDEEPD
jgi:hypothetical protein